MRDEINSAFDRGMMPQGHLTAWRKVLDKILVEHKSMSDSAVVVIAVDDASDDGSEDGPKFYKTMRIPLGVLRRMG